LLFSKKPNELESWIYEAEKLNITEVNSFLVGLHNDLPAVENGIIMALQKEA
jgi:hypothetical protein